MSYLGTRRTISDSPRGLRADEVVHGTRMNPVVTKEGVGDMVFIGARLLLKVQKDRVLFLEFFNWVGVHKPSLHSLDMHSIILHIFTKNCKFKSAESILKKILESGLIDLPSKLFEAILNSYRICDS